MKKIIYKDGIFILNDKEINFYEGLYLAENKEAEIFDENGNKIEINKFFENEETRIKYLIYKDLKNKKLRFGSGLKFGGLFRVYEKPNDEHSKWILFPVKENDRFVVYDFLSKNRVAHSTRKNLFIALIRNDNIEYLEIKWKKL